MAKGANKIKKKAWSKIFSYYSKKFRSPTSSFLGFGTFEILFCHQIRYDMIQLLNKLGVMAGVDEANV